MKIIAPTFLGKHNYPNYDLMIKEIEKYFRENDDLVIDLEFLWTNEVVPYFENVLMDIYDKSFIVRSKEKSKVKKVRDILKKRLVHFSPIEYEDDYYLINIYKD